MTETLMLDADELALLLAALRSDAAPFLAGSALLTLAGSQLQERMLTARQQLLQRGLATLEPNGALVATPEVSALLLGAIRPRLALTLLHTQREGAPMQCWFSLNGVSDGVIVHRSSPNDVHVFQSKTRAEVIEEIQRLCEPNASASASSAAEFRLPTALYERLAGEPEPNLLAELARIGMSEPIARSFLAAGSAPDRQTVLTALSGATSGVNRVVECRAVQCFSDAASSWLILNFNDDGKVVARLASKADIHKAVEAMVMSDAQ